MLGGKGYSTVRPIQVGRRFGLHAGLDDEAEGIGVDIGVDVSVDDGAGVNVCVENGGGKVGNGGADIYPLSEDYRAGIDSACADGDGASIGKGGTGTCGGRSGEGNGWSSTGDEGLSDDGGDHNYEGARAAKHPKLATTRVTVKAAKTTGRQRQRLRECAGERAEKFPPPPIPPHIASLQLS